MHIGTHLEVDLVAVDIASRLTCLLEISAPEATQGDRPPRTLILVLDRSGSMAGARLAAAQSAIVDLIRRLAPADSFGLVTFNNEATLALPVRPMGACDREALIRRVQSIRPGGSTNLGSGYLLGLREARSAVAGSSSRSATVLVLSDGHANVGLVDAGQLLELAHGAATARVTTSSVGIGDAYDETLLAALSQGGGGVHHFAPDPDSAAAIVATTVSDLLAVSILAATVRIEPVGGLARGVRVLQSVPIIPDGESLIATLGDLYSGEERRLLIQFDVPGLSELGPQTIATFTVVFTVADTLIEHRVTLPVRINVLPADELGTPEPNPRVVTERLLWQADEERTQAADDLRGGRTEEARTRLTQMRTDLAMVQAAAPSPEVAEDLAAAIGSLDRDLSRLDEDDVNANSKLLYAQASPSKRGGMSRERTERVKRARAAADSGADPRAGTTADPGADQDSGVSEADPR